MSLPYSTKFPFNLGGIFPCAFLCTAISSHRPLLVVFLPWRSATDNVQEVFGSAFIQKVELRQIPRQILLPTCVLVFCFEHSVPIP